MKPVLSDEVQVQTIQLVRLSTDGTLGNATVDQRTRYARFLLDRLPFAAMVLLPTLLAVVYAFGLSAPRYLSEAKYVVRTPADSTASQVASLVQASTVTRSTDDAYIAKEYMVSRDAMQQLIDKDGLMDMFAKSGLDVLWRYPLFFKTANLQDLAKHYLRFVHVEYDSSTGISTLSVTAFTAADAQRLATALITHTEAFLNRLNTRAQHDAIDSAVHDVALAKQDAYDALDKVTAFRNLEETVDPTKASAGIVSSITSLSLETATTNAHLAELMTDTPQSPEIPSLRSRIAALQAQVVKQRQQLGGDTSSLAPRIEQYERLLLEQGFAEKAFISALTSLETARIDANHQRVFLELVAMPDVPDYAAYPYRMLIVLATFGASLVIWRVFSVVGKDTREHARL